MTWKIGDKLALMRARSNALTPATPVVGAAAPVTAYDAVTGRLQINGVEQGDTGWRKILSWTSGVQDANNQIDTINTVDYEIGGNLGYVMIRRIGHLVEWRTVAPGMGTPSMGKRAAGGHLFTSSTSAIPTGFRYAGLRNNADRRFQVPVGRVAVFGNTSNSNLGAILFSTTDNDVDLINYGWNYMTSDAWPVSLPGTAA